MSETIETIAVPFQADAADRLKRVAAELGMSLEDFIASAAEQFVTDVEYPADGLSDEQAASIRRGLADVAAGRTFSHDSVFSELRARFKR